MQTGTLSLDPVSDGTFVARPDYIEPARHSMGDVGPVLAARARERRWRGLEDEHTIGAGAHFPGLESGRLRTGSARRWCGQAGWNEGRLR